MNILILTGSARPASVSSAVAKLVADTADRRPNITTTIVEVADLDLPFFDAAMPPSSPDYTPPHDSVRAWGEMVAGADAVVLVMPEYNHSMSAVQKNAIDWLSAEWRDKPVGLVGYNWYDEKTALSHARISLGIVKARTAAVSADLRFKHHIEPDGSVIDATEVTTRINAMLDSLLANI